MSGDIPESLLDALSVIVSRDIGLHFPKERRADLVRGIRTAALEMGFEDIEACIRTLTAEPLSRRQIETLASHLTIGETYFFRDRRAFEALEQMVLPELIRARTGREQRLRIWSAGCCTGEEPYSVAILLRKLLP